MKSVLKKQAYTGIIYGMIPFLFFSCSVSHPFVSSSPGKHATQFADDKFKTLYYDGLIQKVQGNYDKAEDYFRQCLSVSPTNPAANFEVAQMLENNKEPDSALGYMKKAVAGDPENIWYGYFYAGNLQQLGKYKEEIKVYNDLIKAHPGTTDIYYKLALAQLQAQEYKEAIKTYNILQSKSDSADEDLAMNKIEILEKIKEYPQAEDEIKKLIRNYPTTSQYSDMLGNLYDLEGKRAQAYQIYQKMEQEYPHDAMVHLSLADYYKTTNNDNLAYEELKKAFAEPTLDIDTKIRIVLALNTFTSSDSIFSEALTLSREMVLAHPAEPRAHAIYGQFLQHNKDLEQARVQYRIAVSEDSGRYGYWGQLLDIEAQLNDAGSLENESRKAIGMFPNNAQLYYYNGLANMQLKNYHAAVSAFKSGTLYVINDSTLLDLFYQNIGDASYFMKKYSASDSAYNEALKINPNNDYVLNNYSYFLSVRDTNLEMAEKMSKKSNGLVQNNNSYEDTYAWILYMSGKYENAKEWEYKAIMDGGDKDATILEHYGNILFKLGDKGLALEYWLKAKQYGANSELLDREIKDKQLYEK
jgi:tetratricopeptide (TPR) repeat protein